MAEQSLVQRLTQKLAQNVSDASLSSSPKLLSKIATKIFGKCRRLLVHFGDPLIRYDLDGSHIELPLSHELPIHRKSFPSYSSNVARIALHVVEKYKNLTFLDIGANVGDTVAILRGQAHFPILCIEGDHSFLPLLKSNIEKAACRDVFIEPSFVGVSTRQISAKIQSLGGTSHLVEDTHAKQSVELRTLEDILKSHPKFAQSKMLKIDTDGLDCAILSSELNFLSKVKPVVFFEYAPFYFQKQKNHEDGFSVFSGLRDAGYKTALIYENNGDYLLSVELSNQSLLEDVHQFYSGRGSSRYCDIAVFHEEDSDLAKKIRRTEIDYFKAKREALESSRC